MCVNVLLVQLKGEKWGLEVGGSGLESSIAYVLQVGKEKAKLNDLIRHSAVAGVRL